MDEVKPNLFSHLQGVANRGCSVRVGRETEQKGKGDHSAMTYNCGVL